MEYQRALSSKNCRWTMNEIGDLEQITKVSGIHPEQFIVKIWWIFCCCNKRLKIDKEKYFPCAKLMLFTLKSIKQLTIIFFIRYNLKCVQKVSNKMHLSSFESSSSDPQLVGNNFVEFQAIIIIWREELMAPFFAIA